MELPGPGCPADLYIEGGRIAAVRPASSGGKSWEKGNFTEIDLSGLKVFPGLIDIHIHGACGHDFTEGTGEALEAAAADMVKDGVTAFAASLTVLSPGRMKEALRSLGELRNRGSGPDRGGARFLGVHSEGPFIAAEYKALMDERYIRPPDADDFEEMAEAARGALILMTFSPHYDSFPCLFPIAERRKIAMMIGHSSASAGEAAAALDRGAAGYTHLYNAMSGHHHRNPGVVSAALSDRRGYAELIADTVHVCPRVLRFTWDLLGSKRIILVSDAMPGKSMGDGEFIFSNLPVVKKDGRAWVKETGRLAGSVAPLNRGLKNMAEICGAGDGELAEMASANPAKLLGLYGELGGIGPGKRADLAVFDGAYNTVMTIVGGRIVYRAD
jgi:N-acetylglucosamine-6-phosphate deacetylase